MRLRAWWHKGGQMNGLAKSSRNQVSITAIWSVLFGIVLAALLTGGIAPTRALADDAASTQAVPMADQVSAAVQVDVATAPTDALPAQGADATAAASKATAQTKAATASALKVGALGTQATSVSPNVTTHTKVQIIDYLANSGVSINDPTTYAVEPVFYTQMGDLSAQTKQKALAMLNNVRYIAGLNPVTLSDEYGKLAQAGTFADHAVGTLTHYPAKSGSKPDDMAEDVWQMGITGASSSNISWGATLLGAIRSGWMADDDAGNIPMMGHRRWCLNPTMGATGFGFTGTYGAMYSIDWSGSGSQGNVVWPAQVMPIEYFGPTFPWTISTGSEIANIASVKVMLTNKNTGATWVFDQISDAAPTDRTAKYFNVDNGGYASPGCIIFRPDNVTYTPGDVFHVKAEGVNGKTIEYDVEFFSGYPVTSASFDQDTYYRSYSGGKLPLNIEPADASGYKVEWKSSNADAITVSDDGKLTVVAPGTSTITATIAGEYTKSGSPITATVQVVVPKSLYTYGNVELDYSSLQYTGKTIEPKATLTDTETDVPLVEGKDYTIEVEGDAVEPDSKITVWFIGKNAYNSGVGHVVYVQKRVLAEEMATLTPASLTYTGSEQHPQVTLSFNGMTLVEGTDFTTRFNGGTGVGDYTATIAGAGSHYTGTITKSFSIAPKALEESMLKTDPLEFTYNGSEQKPTVTLTFNDKPLAEGVDYDVALSGSPVAAGSYKLTVTGKGNFTGSLERTFKINKAPQPPVMPPEQVSVPYGTSTLAADVLSGAAGWEFDAAALGAALTPGKATPFQARYTAADAANYETTTAQVTVTRSTCAHATTEMRGVVAPTCESDGYTGDEYCTVCGELVKAGVTDPAKGHDWDAGTVTTQPTCTEQGVLTSKCSRCTQTTTEPVAAKGHAWASAYTVDKAPTCTAEGEESIHCTVCNAIREGSARLVDKIEHTYGAWKQTQAPTCEAAGLEERACTACGDKQTRPVDALGHKWSEAYAVDKPATCTAKGSESQHCTVCGAIKDGSARAIPMIEHTYGDWKVTVQPTCTEEGEQTHECTACGHSETQPVPMIEHKYGEWAVAKEATCTEEGMRVRKCEACGQEASEAIATIDHKYGEWKVTKEATCTTEGEREHACEACGKVETELVAKVAHKYGAWKTTKAATVDATGAQERECAVCGQKETRTVAKLKPTEVTAADAAKMTPAQVAKAIPTEVSPSTPAAAAVVDRQLTSAKSDADPKGAGFGLLQAKGAAKSKTANKVTWKKVKGATAYAVYANKCGKNNQLKKVKTIKGTSFTHSKLKKGTYYKYLVVALKGGKALATSKVIHVATKGGKVGNSKSVTVTNAKKGKITLKKGKSLKLKTKTTPQSKKLKVKKHRAVAFESSNKKVATVTKAGVVKAKKKGTCYVYAYAQNGVCKAVKVTVK